MSIENLTKWYVHINKFGLAARRVVGSKDLCDPSLKYEVLVKFEEAVEASSNSIQQLKAEICEHADCYIKECQYDGLESLVVKNFSRWLVRKLSAV